MGGDKSTNGDGNQGVKRRSVMNRYIMYSERVCISSVFPCSYLVPESTFLAHAIIVIGVFSFDITPLICLKSGEFLIPFLKMETIISNIEPPRKKVLFFHQRTSCSTHHENLP